MHHASTSSVLTHTLKPRVGSRVKKIFSESSHVAYQLNGNSATCKHIFCSYTHTHDSWGEVNGSKHFFLNNNSHIAYQIKGNGT